MYIKVFPHGKGNGRSPTQYLVRLDYPNRKENPPVVLRGDVDKTQQIIDSLSTQWKFTAGVLSWHPDDAVSPEKEQEIMDAFENLAFAGLEQDQRNILWVHHSHAKHHELHFVIPRVEFIGARHIIPVPLAGRNLLMSCVIISISKKIGQDPMTQIGQDCICLNRLT
ncbi:hypothetical protein JBF11_08575 [Taurinivorans muris]|uniref:MobA/VirD2-like nuclease domain-containing protein n=1 Tax=Taurinivorans muris TaxID=2787751 RepID=A0ABY5Y0G6_9BACT|nr:hypothetical protein JBF11_08575 [Desulfovibrionaceae bacterium LT0009]